MSQPPLMTEIAGGGTDAVATWEAHAEHDIGVMLSRYIAENPPPGPSSIADAVLVWAEKLSAAGQAALEERSVPRLRLA
jgi:hypothetical protein